MEQRLNRSATVMTDKEVGNCWRCCTLLPPPGEEAARQLIRKLVEERALNYAPYAKDKQDFIPDALRDFGIDPATWEDE